MISSQTHRLPFFATLVLTTMLFGCAGSKRETGPRFLLNDSFQSDKGVYGDSKLVGLNSGEIYFLATKNSRLHIKSFTADWSSYTNLDIPANWLGVEGDGNGNIIAITSSGTDKRIRIYRIDPSQMSWELLSVLGSAEILKIDPAIEKVKDKWFITFTSIEGTVNNQDPNLENGTYDVEIYSSGNLIDWERLSTIISRKSNVEDGRLYYSNRLNKFLFVFEQEDYDKGPSSLKVIESGDMGRTWTNEQFVLGAIADSEPAGMFEIGCSVYVFFSSDINNPGRSYEGGNVFYVYSKNGLSSWSSPNTVEFSDSILLVDVIMAGERMYFAAFKNYLSNRQMILFNGILKY